MNRKLLIEEIDTQISEFKNILKSENNHDILEEKVLDLLGKIEEKVFQIVGNKNNSTPLQKEIIFQRFVAMHIIDTEYTSIDDFLDELISKIYQDIVNNKTILTHDLFLPGTSNIESNGIENKKEKLKTLQKNKILQRVFYKLGYKDSEIDVFEEKVNPDRMRKIPYNIYHIKIKENPKTILICDQIGQATFVYDSIIDTNILKNIEKGETIGNSQALKIIYSKKTFKKNLEIALSDKLSFEEKEEKIVNENEEIADIEKKDKITKEELFVIFHTYKGTPQESYDYFMSLSKGSSDNPDSIKGLRIKGNSITRIKSISGIDVEGYIQNPLGFREWIQEIFQGQDIIFQELEKKEEKEAITKEELFQILHTYKNTPQESYDYFMSLSKGNKDIPDTLAGLKIKGNSITGLKNISGINIKGNMGILAVFREWIQEIFQGQDIIFQELEKKEEKEAITKEELFQILHTYKDNPQESYDYFMNLSIGNSDNPDSIKGLKIKGNSIRGLKTISGIKIKGYIETLLVFREWIQDTFQGQDIIFQELEKKEEKEKITKEELFEILHAYKCAPKKSYDYFMSLSRGSSDNPDSIKGLKIKGNSINGLKTISGIKIKGNIENPSVFREWIQEIFKGQDIIFQELKK